WPPPPQPKGQIELPVVCVGRASWSVLLLFDASASALLRAVWSAELEPPLRAFPEIETGSLALCAVCFARASASASCLVSPTWITFCSWPLPPQPEKQLELPAICVGFASWSVVLLFDASASALLLAV